MKTMKCQILFSRKKYEIIISLSFAKLAKKAVMGKVTASRKHIYIILTPLTPLLSSNNGVYRGILFFSFFFFFCFCFFFYLLENIDCEYMLEPRRRGGSNEYPQSMF